MEVQINWLAVVLAAISTMIVGFTWYAKPIFGNKWLKLIGKKEKELNQSAWPMIITFLVSFITAYVLAHMSYIAANFYNMPLLQGALLAALWGWLGFTAARIITHDAFENRPKTLTVLTTVHELITFVVMALIIGVMGV